MLIEFEVKISKEHKELLNDILHCNNDENLNKSLNKIGRSSFEEIIRMILGQKVFTRGKDLLEFRLYNLILHYFDGRIPEEQRICEFFQITASESRSYTRSVLSKYQYGLKKAIKSSLLEQIVNIKKEDEDNEEVYKLSIENLYFKDELNRILGSIDTSLPMIEKERGTISTYKIQPSSYQELCNYFDIKIENEYEN